MKHIAYSLVLCGLVFGGLVAAPVHAAVAPIRQLTASVSDYYSGLATGQGYQDYYARIYGAGSPAYTAAINSEYLRGPAKPAHRRPPTTTSKT
ncbi:hypothetical protein [Hymenobacter rigui]|uniref:Uncharacterized protein n=1 Tax=Hymenobacter rigui TaxID=334424 RepID=A0A428KTE7_9BACT|nr:hypothetical protein [Hymenobacter rigui]RSK49886.1 hypothetical protein EI291_04370 [Hymenobacter rigui]